MPIVSSFFQLLSMSQNSELVCTYATLILHDAGHKVTADGISNIAKAAGIELEPFWPNLFAGIVGSQNLDDLILNAGAVSGGDHSPHTGSAPAHTDVPATGGKGGAAPPPKEKTPEPDSSGGGMGFDFFDS